MSIQSNVNAVLKDFKKTSGKIRKVEVWALNRAGRDTHPEAKRKLREKYNVKSRTINKAKDYIRKANSYYKVYTLQYRDRRVNVKDYGIRQIKSGIKWKVVKGETVSLEHGFKVGHNSPHPARKLDGFGMIRTGKYKLARGRSGRTIRRETIKSVTGPSVPQLLNQSGVNKHLRKFFAEKYRVYFNKRLKSI